MRAALSATPSTLAVRSIAAGAGWRVSDVRCAAGPHDLPFEEQHGWISVAAVMSGSFSYRCDQGEATMTPGALLLGNAGACYCCSHAHGVGDRCVSFQFDPDVFEDVAADLRAVTTIAFAQPRIAPGEALVPLLTQVQALLHGHDVAAAEEAAWRIASAALCLQGEGRLRTPDSRDVARVLDGVRHIEQHLDQPIVLHQLAADAGLSRFHFLRVFRQVVGTTPYQFVLARRMQRAATRLRGSHDSVLAIALACGFADLSEFSRRFRARFGLPPGAYRRAVARS